jgi:pimeloyl-ACP methyl ester carboxylesterase
MRDVNVRGVRMRVLEAGEGNDTPVVLLHDLLDSHEGFDSVIDRLATRFHVVAPDFPGFGQSEKPSVSRYEYGVDAFAEAVADLISAYGLGRARVIGHGLGGGVAITLAARHAELVSRLALVAPLCYACPPSRKLRPALWPLIGGSIFKQLFSWRQFRGYFSDEVFSSDFRASAGRIERAYGHFNSPLARESAYAVLRSMLDTRAIVARVTRIRQPTLVTWGRQDKIYPSALALKLAREIPDARLELFDAGHAPHEEHPAEFAHRVGTFLEAEA